MASNRTTTARVQMLDNSIHTYDVKANSFGTMLAQSVMKDLNLLEADYFGIVYKDKQGVESFLDPLKKLKVQIPNMNNVVLKFVVKFFPPDPGQLQEEYTRYLFALQLKRDIVDGLLPCNENTIATMASYMVQSEFGDWNHSVCKDLTYLKELKLLPLKSNFNEEEMFSKIAEQHKLRAGQTSADADYHLLDIVRRLEHYGIRLHPALDQENTEISVAAAHMGVEVFRGNSKINTFNWSRIRKLSFKKKRFLIKLRTEANLDNHSQSVGDVLVFVMASRDACKSFWRHCIEYHAFFRLEVHPVARPKPLILKRGSTFRYSGKTQKQLHELVRNSNFRRTTFARASSRKSSAHSAATSWTPVAPPTIPVVENGPKADNVVQSGEGVVLSPIRPDGEVNGHLKSAEVTNTSEDDQKSRPGYTEVTPTSSDSWQVKSENLHSSVIVSNRNSEKHAEYEKPGKAGHKPMHATLSNNNNSLNQEDQHFAQGPDILYGVDSGLSPLSDVFLANSSSYTNDNSELYKPTAPYLSKNILSIESVSNSSKSSRSSVNRSSSSSSRRSKVTLPLPPPPPPPPQTDSSSEEEEEPSPPPLPPKMSSPLRPSKEFTPKVAQITSSSAIKKLPNLETESPLQNEFKPVLRSRLDNSISLSVSELSLPSIAGGEPRTPSQYAALEQKMIKAGFYSVPTKPPILPDDDESNSKEFDSDIDRALNELDIATQTLERNFVNGGKRSSDHTNDSHDGLYGVVVDSDDEEDDDDDSHQAPSKNLTFGIDKNLLTPIPMKFNDYYTGPDYGSNDALSSFAVEMEASFDRIRESLSKEDLSKQPRLQVIPKTSSINVLPSTDLSSYCNITYGTSNHTGVSSMSRFAVNANNNNSVANRVVSGRFIRRESDEIVDL